MEKYIYATSIKLDGNMSATFGLEQAVDNREKFISSRGLDPDGLILTKQTHGNVFVKVDSSKLGLATTNTYSAKADAMVTDDPKVVLAVFTADCLPIFLYDENKKCSGIAHAGRKGTVAHIADEIVRALIKHFDSKPEDINVSFGPCIHLKHFDSKPEDINVSFGPCIHQCHFEQQHPQDKDKIDEFTKLFPDAVEQRMGTYFFDLIKANSAQLINAGIQLNKIDYSMSECTADYPDTYWSYHKIQRIEGSMINIIGVKKGELA